MKIPVGPLTYDLQLHKGIITYENQQCFGLTDPVAQTIFIADTLRPRKRLATAWHEICEAWKLELDIHQSQALNAESMANLIGMAMAGMPPQVIARLHVYMMRGIDADEVLFVSGFKNPLPVIRLSDAAPPQGETSEPASSAPRSAWSKTHY